MDFKNFLEKSILLSYKLNCAGNNDNNDSRSRMMMFAYYRVSDNGEHFGIGRGPKIAGYYSTHGKTQTP